MKFTNYEIYNIAMAYQDAFTDFKAYIPAKANFKLQKNIAAITAAAAEIDKLRVEILKQYGEEKDGSFSVLKENADIAQSELNDLLMQEQEIDIKTLDIDAFGSVEFTPLQMQVLMFMIED
jgi:hypothetical protein